MNLKEQFEKVVDSYRFHRKIWNDYSPALNEAVFDAIKELNVTKSQELEQLFKLVSNRDLGTPGVFNVIFDKKIMF